MLYWVWIILSCWRLVLPVTGIDNGDADILNFKLEPIKYSDYNAIDEDFCLEMELSEGEELTSNVLFTFYVLDVLPFTTDVNRFGGTSKDRGRQFLHMSIEDPGNGNLLRSTRNLKSGITHIELNPGSSRQFKICLSNLVYDSSWSSLDIWKYVAVRLNTKEKLAWSKLDSLQDEHLINQEIENCMNQLSHSINGNPFRELKSTEIEHRNMNENSFEIFLITLILMVISVSLSPIVLAYYCIRYKGFTKSNSPKV